MKSEFTGRRRSSPISKKIFFYYSIQLSFGLILHARELELLKLIQSELSGVGYISESVYGRVHYQISNIKDLEILFALLDEFPLLTRKMRNYQLFKEA